MAEVGIKMFALIARSGAEIPDVVYVLTCEATDAGINLSGFVAPRIGADVEWTFHTLVRQAAQLRPGADLIIFTAAPVTHEIVEAWGASDLDPSTLPHCLAWATSNGRVSQSITAGPMAEA